MTRKTRRSRAAGAMARVTAAAATLAPWLARAAWCVAATAVVAGGAAGVPRLRPAVAADAWADDVAVVLVDRPAWVGADLESALAETCRRQLGGDPFAQGDLVAVRSALVQCGWFDRVDQVRRTAPDEIEVRAAFVRPAAVVRDDEADHLVDGAGRLLPRSFPHDGARHQTAIVGARFDRPQRPGSIWEGGDVAAGLAVLHLLAGKPWRTQIAAIDVGEFLTDGRIVVRTDLGARIIWGSAPGSERALEVTAPAKVRYLDDAFRHFGRIDTGRNAELHFYEQGYFAR